MVTDMPLMGTEMDYVTKRTTNFSNVVIEHDGTFGLTAVQMYSMLAFNKSGEELWKDAENGDEADKEKQLELIECCRKYLELPVVLKDENNEFIGLTKNMVDSTDLFQVSLKPSPTIKLVLQELLERENRIKAGAMQSLPATTE